MKQKFTSNYWWYMPVLLGTLSFVIVLLCGSTTKSFWNIRSFAANCIAVCILGHFMVMLWMFIRKQWRNFLVTVIMSPFILFITFTASLIVGPSIESVTEKVALALSIPKHKMKCLGGRLSRESTVVFEILDATQLHLEDSDIMKDKSFWPYLKERSKRFGVLLPEDSKVWYVRLEFDTLVVVCWNGHSIVFFCGNSIM